MDKYRSSVRFKRAKYIIIKASSEILYNFTNLDTDMWIPVTMST